MTDVSSVTAFNNFLSLYHPPSPWPPLLDGIPMPGFNAKVQRFEGWHYDAFAGVVPRRRAHGRDLEKTFSTPFVTFKSIDSIQPSDAHFLSLASTTPSISIAAQEFSQHLSSYDVSLISDESSINDTTDLSSSLTAFSLPTGVGLGILGLTRKEGGVPFDGLGLVHIGCFSGDPSSSGSDGEISNTILHDAALMFLQPSIPVESVVVGHSEPEKTKPVDMPSPRNRPRRSLTRNLSASTVSSSLKRASKTGGSSEVDRGRSWR